MALLSVLKSPTVGTEKLVDLIPGPDFPTGGVLVENRAAVVQAYDTGAGLFVCGQNGTRKTSGAGNTTLSSRKFPFRFKNRA